jgi:phosphoribosylaminoimidazole-succinocarboxamide synthase
MSMVGSRYIGSGKVRELYEVGTDRIVLVASDRISAYDVVMAQSIPDKGRVLTALSQFWFETLSDICPNHCLSVSAADMSDLGIPDVTGRAMLCRRAEPLPVEFVVRGYLSGSGWRDYRSTGEVCGNRLPEGLVESDRLPEPIVTPATKATTGHDENITEEHAARIAGEDFYRTARDYALELYVSAASRAGERGVIVADTKFEFGISSGEVVLIDEALTPDSSRFWPADRYSPGGAQPSFDKQFVRDWLDSVAWDHTPPPPELPQDVVEATRSRYIEAYERITSRIFADWMAEAAR